MNAYKKFIINYKLTHDDMATLLEVNIRTSIRWANEERSIPNTVIIVLKLMKKFNITPFGLEKIKKEMF